MKRTDPFDMALAVLGFVAILCAIALCVACTIVLVRGML